MFYMLLLCHIYQELSSWPFHIPSCLQRNASSSTDIISSKCWSHDNKINWSCDTVSEKSLGICKYISCKRLLLMKKFLEDICWHFIQKTYRYLSCSQNILSPNLPICCWSCDNTNLLRILETCCHFIQKRFYLGKYCIPG